MKDVKVKLSALWAARMLSGLQGDSTRLHDPVALKEIVAGTSAVQVTNQLLLVMSIIFAVPILMSFLSLTLKDKANRYANRSMGIFFALFDLVFLGLSLFLWPFSAYETFWSIVYLVFTTLVVWYAWTWPKKRESIPTSLIHDEEKQ
jgi:predicted membrane protein